MESKLNPISSVYYKVHSTKEDTEDLETTSFDNAIKLARSWSEEEPETVIEIVSVKIETQTMYGFKNGKIAY